MGFGKDGKGVIIRESRTQAVGTLANSTGLLIGTKLATLERFRMLKSEVMATFTGVTQGEGSGMWLLLADGDLSLTEIEEAIEGIGPLGPNDAVLAAVAERFVLVFGATDSEVATTMVFHNEMGGHLMSKNPRWTFSRTKSWNWVLYNQGVAPTTGITVNIKVKSFGVWVT